MWMLRKILMFVLLAVSVVTKGQDTLAYWGMNESSGTTTKEIITNTDYNINSKWPVIERVPGIRQNALRTDGYTTWIDGNVTNAYPVDSFSVSAWMAPEVYPVDMAAVWSYFDQPANKGAYLAINKFGNVVVNFTVNNQAITMTSLARVEHYKWNFLVLNVDAVHGNCTVYNNGVAIINESFLSGTLSWPSIKTFLARTSSTVNVQTIYPINYLNCILDEVIVRKKRWTAAQVQQEYASLNPAATPDMKTPASRFTNDFHRPKYHPVPNNAWANESHGLFLHNGVYHMFYQKNGNGPFFSQQNWGHLTSTDLVNWQETQPALYPQPGWESVGAWSGHAVKDASGNPILIYTGVNGAYAGIGSAHSSAELNVWTRNASNPLIQRAPVSPSNKDFRDPYVFKEGNTWYMIIGTGINSPETGTVFLYKSTDLNSWQYVKPLFIDNSGYNNVGIFWEMPVFWKIGSKYLLLVNKTPVGPTPAKAFYWVGDFTNEVYTPTNPVVKNLDIINSLLSPSVNVDDQGRTVAIGIVPDLLPPHEQYDNGWANFFSLPRVWQMQNDSLFQSPHPNLDAGRGMLYNFNTINLQSTSSNYLNLKGFRAEIKATITKSSATKVGFTLQKKADNSEYTRIYYDYNGLSFVVDRSKASTNPSTPRDVQSEFFMFPNNDPVEWHIYTDGSVIEVFINNKWAFATRVYPADAESKMMDFFVEGGTATATNVQVWDRGDVTSTITGLFDSYSSNYKNIKIYPMPATDRAVVQLPNEAVGRIRICLYDVTGKMLQTIETKASTPAERITLDLKDQQGNLLRTGNYFMVVHVNNKNLYRSKISVIQN